ncbi:uncharacterized protein LOC106473579 [Limulus polyphemus]|uniref:Uncharacterized protein LOC106473579 n=1 Tax=Limulus polyphemus TaxID=6850 RepID=A0ABM1TP83_LIMPO|nr:uncharacterized protein LOC106473579 [Limulus polyphemus]
MASLDEVAVKYFTKRAELMFSKNNVQKMSVGRFQGCLSQASRDVLEYFQLNYAGRFKKFFMDHPDRFLVDSENNILLVRQPADSSVKVKPQVSENADVENLEEGKMTPLSENLATLGFLSAFLKTKVQPVPLSETSLAYSLMNDNMKKLIQTCEGHAISQKIASFLRSFWFFEISKAKKIHLKKDKEIHEYLGKAENFAIKSMCICYILQGYTDIKQIYHILNEKYRFLVSKFLGLEEFSTFLNKHRNIFFLPGGGKIHMVHDPSKKEPVDNEYKFLKTISEKLDKSQINNHNVSRPPPGEFQNTRYADVVECRSGTVEEKRMQSSQINRTFVHVESEDGQRSHDVVSSHVPSISTVEGPDTTQKIGSCCSFEPHATVASKSASDFEPHVTVASKSARDFEPLVTVASKSASENDCKIIYSTDNEDSRKEISANLHNLPEEHIKIWHFVKEVIGHVVYVGREGSIIQCLLNNAEGSISCLIYYPNNSYDSDDRGCKAPTLSMLTVGSLVRCILDDNIGYQFGDKVMMFAKNIIMDNNSGRNGVYHSLGEITKTTDCAKDRKIESLVSDSLTKNDDHDDNSIVQKKRINSSSCTKNSNLNDTTHPSVSSADEKLRATDNFHFVLTSDEAVIQPEPNTDPKSHTQQPVFVSSETNCSRSSAVLGESNLSIWNIDSDSQQERDSQQDSRHEGTKDDIDVTYLSGFQDATKILMQVQLEIGSILAQKRNKGKQPEDVLDDVGKVYSSKTGFYKDCRSVTDHQTQTEIISLNSSCQTISTGPVYIKKCYY